MKTNLSKRMISLILTIVLLVGVLPTAAFATEEEEATTTTTENVEMAPVGDEEEAVADEVTEDTELPAEEVVETTTEPVESVEDEAENVTTPAEENVVNATATTTSEDVVSTNYGRTFRMPGRYYDFITSHERYGTCDYLAYVSGEELIIFFFDEDISDKEFVLTDAWGDDYVSGFGASFGYCPQFTSYTYDKNTLELKRKTSGLYPFNGYKFTYTYVSSFDVFWYRYNDPRFYDHAGSLPKIDIPNPPEDAQNVTMGRNFTLPGDNVWVLQNCEEYGKKDYLAFVWEEIYVIWFFDDISDVKFYKWDKLNDLDHYFGIKPSRNILFTKYTFNRSTLKFNEKEELMLNTDNLYGLNYTFDASIDIYWDNSYDRDNMFYDHSGTLPKVEIQNPPQDIWNVTNGKSFHAKADLLWLLQNHNEYGSKDYLAYEWNDDIRIWFFDDISNVKFSAYEKFGDNFANYYGIRPSTDVTFIEYVYNKNTLNLKRVEERSFITSNGFTFMYPFTASFDIYTDDSRTEYFYEANKNWSDTPDKGEPLNGIGNTTGSRGFYLAGKFTRIITEHRDFGSKAYLAYERGNEFSILFFEDINGVEFSTSDIQNMNFRLKTSKEVQYTQYTYDIGTLQIKNVTVGTSEDLANIIFPYYFMANFYIYLYDSDGGYFYRINGNRPTLPTVKVSTIERNKFSRLPEAYCKLIEKCPEYKQGQRYLAYADSGGINFTIMFFDDPDVKFSAVEKLDSFAMFFGIQPSVTTRFKAYVYKWTTLDFKYETVDYLPRDNGYILSYRFMSNIDIYKDETYKTYFYFGDEAIRNASYMFNVTNERNFSMPNSVIQKVEQLREDDETLKNKNFLAYSWNDKNIIWFFDLQNKKVSKEDRAGNTFCLLFSSDIEVTAFLYDRETGAFVEQSTFTVGTSNGYTFGHYFIADFNIYKDNRLFYNAGNNTVGRTLKFTPLDPQEAKNFLKFLTNTVKDDEMKGKMQGIYEFLIGEVKNPKEELQHKLAFLDIAYKCMDIQLSNCGLMVGETETALVEWLKKQSIQKVDEDGNPTGELCVSTSVQEFIKKFLVEAQGFLVETIAKGTMLQEVKIPNYSTINDFLDYNHMAINTVKGITLIRTIDNIQYLKAYKRLLDAIDHEDETSIQLAETNCFIVRLNMSMGCDAEEMERYARYLYIIEKTLPEDYYF